MPFIPLPRNYTLIDGPGPCLHHGRVHMRPDTESLIINHYKHYNPKAAIGVSGKCPAFYIPSQHNDSMVGTRFGRKLYLYNKYVSRSTAFFLSTSIRSLSLPKPICCQYVLIDTRLETCRSLSKKGTHSLTSEYERNEQDSWGVGVLVKSRKTTWWEYLQLARTMSGPGPEIFAI
jgi:hypothetical protein